MTPCLPKTAQRLWTYWSGNEGVIFVGGFFPLSASSPTLAQAVVSQSSCIGHSSLAHSGIIRLALPPSGGR